MPSCIMNNVGTVSVSGVGVVTHWYVRFKCLIYWIYAWLLILALLLNLSLACLSLSKGWCLGFASACWLVRWVDAPLCRPGMF